MPSKLDNPMVTPDSEQLRLIKCLNVTDKHGIWYQMEITSGPRKGMRFPIARDNSKTSKK